MINTQKLNKFTLIFLSWLMLFTLQASAQTNSANRIEINKLPLEEFSRSLLINSANKEIDLTKPFLVELKSKLTDRGTFDNSNSRYIKTEGDKDIVEVVKFGIEAVGDSRFLSYLKDLDIRDISIIVKQDDKNLSVQLVSVMKSPQVAKTTASGLAMLIPLSKQAKKREITGGEKDVAKRQSEKDQLYLLHNTSVTSEDKNFVLQMKLPKAKAHEMLNRNLKNFSEKRNK